jgi:Arm DNA-binding domain
MPALISRKRILPGATTTTSATLGSAQNGTRMARVKDRLSALEIKNAKPGRHCDGGGLYLQCTIGTDKKRKKSWVFRYVPRGGHERQMGLGSCDDVSLAEARTIAADYRKLLAKRIDPQDHRAAEAAAAKMAAGKAKTFDQCAAEFIKAHQASWRNAKHTYQWPSTIKNFVSPCVRIFASQLGRHGARNESLRADLVDKARDRDAGARAY